MMALFLLFCVCADRLRTDCSGMCKQTELKCRLHHTNEACCQTLSKQTYHRGGQLFFYCNIDFPKRNVCFIIIQIIVKIIIYDIKMRENLCFSLFHKIVYKFTTLCVAFSHTPATIPARQCKETTFQHACTSPRSYSARCIFDAYLCNLTQFFLFRIVLCTEKRIKWTYPPTSVEKGVCVCA